MAKEIKGKHFIKKPIYPGGPKALKQFIANHLSYPPEALQERIEGTVYIKYTIDHKGKVIDTKVISSLGHGCDEEAVRLVKLLKFKVEKTRGVKVQFHKNIQIHFRLPVQQPQKVSYSYKSTEQTKEKKDSDKNPDPDKAGGGYNYTISW